MIQIISGNIDAVKAEMNQKTKDIKEEIRHWKTKMKEAVKKKPVGFELSVQALEKKIRELDGRLGYYRVSCVLPVRINGLVVNLKGYQNYVKALKNIPFEVIVGDSQVVIKHNKGRLELHDLSEWFADFQSVPEAEII